MYALSEMRRPKKKTRKEHLSPIAIGTVNVRRGKVKTNIVRILFDSGTSSSIILGEFTKKLKTKDAPSTTWLTKGGTFVTNKICKVQLRLPEFSTRKGVEWKFHVDQKTNSKESRYDMIIGGDLMSELGIDIKYSTGSIDWDGATIPMRCRSMFDDMTETINLHDAECNESDAVRNATSRMTTILDAHYEKANLDNVVDTYEHLDASEKLSLKKLLKSYEYLFDGSLGTWNTEPIDLELQEDAKPYHARPFPVPKIHEDTLKKEVERLCKLGVLRKVNRSEWAAPTFIIPKKNGTVRFISDFRELNKRIKRKPFPIPKIQDLLMKLEGFTYASSLDLNMGYYHIVLTPNARKLCTIVLPWGKYEYNRLPMGVCNSPDIFQEKILELFEGIEFVRAYLDDLLILTKGDWNDHLGKLETVLNRIANAGLKINAEKSFFGRSETEYLGFWITRDGIRPVAKKVEAIQQIDTPKTKKELRRFIGLVNYYRDMWIHRSTILAPLTRLTSSKAKFKWTEVEQKAFNTMKKVISKEVLLTYPDFSVPFNIHTDASKRQLGAVISQRKKPIAFYSRKLNSAQVNYTTTERELLSIVETLKEFRNILLGQQLVVYTDHKNLTYKDFNTERVIRWRLLIEEFGPELRYIKGHKNIVADILSRLQINDLDSPVVENTQDAFAECFALDKLPDGANPIKYSIFSKFQTQDSLLLTRLKRSPHYQLKTFRGGGKSYDLICRNDKIVVPDTLQARVLEWYHTTLLHPGVNRTEETIRQHLWWNTIRTDVDEFVRKCPTCQKAKKQRKKYGHLPEKTAESDPWEKMCVDLIGPYKIARKNKPTLHLQAVTMIDPATGWFEIAEYPDKRSVTIANIVEQQWLSRYPWPQQITYDQGNEFIGHEFSSMVSNDYNIKVRPTTVRNPRANSVLERIHQVLANLIRTQEISEIELDEDDPWAGTLSAAAFAIRSTYHTTLMGTPGQLVFGRDMIFNIQHVADWKKIKLNKQRIIKKNNQNENNKRIAYEYKVGDKILYENTLARKMEPPRTGPYKIIEIHNNGTVTIKRGAIIEKVNIRNIQPYFE